MQPDPTRLRASVAWARMFAALYDPFLREAGWVGVGQASLASGEGI